MKDLFIYGIFLLFSVSYFSAAGQSAKDFHPFGWGAYSRSFSNIFSVFRNEAGLAGIKHFTAGILTEQRFMLAATSSYAFAVAVPVSPGTFCIAGNSFGFEDFRQQQAVLAYGRQLTSWLDAGIQFDYFHIGVPRYGNAHAVTFGIAALVHWNEHWHTGLQAFNPVRVQYNGLGNDAIPAAYRLGIGYQPSKVFLLSAEISKTGNFPAEATFAFRYRMIQYLGLMAGMATGQEKLFLGFTVYLKQFRIVFAGAYHARLGVSPAAGFIYEDD